MRKLEKVAISHNFNFSYHVCKVIVVLLIYHKMFGIK